METKYDFSGWATRNNVKCSDGRTIRKNAFIENNGTTVPLVWNHNHKSADEVLGHALLENRDEGVYAYCSFNETPQGQNAKELVRHKDICSLSIYATQLKQNGGDVMHGSIKEVSLVLAGANPGAFIENIISHGEESEEEAYIFNNSETLDLDVVRHTDDQDDSKNIEHAEKEEIVEEEIVVKEKPKMAEEAKEKTVKEVFDELTEEQKNVVYFLVGQAVEEAKKSEGDEEMKHNIFEGQDKEENVLTHAEFSEINDDAKKSGNLKDAFLAHGITDVGNLFPEVQPVNKTPEMIARDQTWVQKVMAAVHHTPFSRVKSTAANITADAARAKGYIKGHQKVEEVIAALKRTTTPTTVYKLQKMDRDDVIDITDFDVVAWIKQEMRTMLDEEIARAILIGDGRDPSLDDKINPLNIRPILGDNSTYTVSKVLEKEQTDTDYTFAKRFIKSVIKARKEYKGSGNPTLYTTEDMLTNMLLIEDKNERVIYDTLDKLVTALRVKEIVTVPVMEGQVRVSEDEQYDYTCLGILVNLNDYNVGANKGGAVNMFDDFNIDYNKYEYLIETRCSGALVKPYSAVTFELKEVHTPSEG